MVQQFKERSVQDSAQLPGYQQVSYTPDAFGAQAARALQQVGQAGQELGATLKQLEDEKRAADGISQVNAAKDELRPWLFDPTDGIYGKKGGQAMGTGGQASAVLSDIQAKYLEQIDDPKTKEVFTKMWQRESEQVKDSVARHELNEMGTYQLDTVKGTIAGAVQDAYAYFDDEKAIGKAVDDTRRAIRANTLGQPTELVAAAEAEAVSQIHLSAVSRWAGEDPYKALDYFNEHKGDMAGKDLVTATALVDAASANRKAQEFVAGETQAGTGGARLWDAMEHAESTGNPQAESPVGASGIMQLMPDTARELLVRMGRPGLAKLDDAALKQTLKDNVGLNRTLGQTYMNDQLKTYNGDLEAALVAYNAGPGGANDFLRHNVGRAPGNRDYNVPGRPKIKTETEAYTQKILGRMGVGGTPSGTRMTPQNWGLRNFKPQDILAPTAGGQWVDARAGQGLDTLADRMKTRFPGFEIKINEASTGQKETRGRRRGTADPKDNPHVEDSQHLHGTAFDVQVQSWSDEQKAAFISEARSLGFGGVGFYGPAGHLHIDMGKERSWGAVPAWAKEAMKTPLGKVPAGVGSEGPQVVSLGGGVTSADLPTGRNSILGNGTSSSDYYADTSGFDLTTSLEKAQMIADPTERERTIAMLRLEASKTETQQKAEEQAAKDEGWKVVLAGSVDDLTPEQLGKLDPAFVNSLYSYQANREKGGPETDWKAWANIPTDDKALAALDVYTEYRNILADEQFKKLVDMKREAEQRLNGQGTSSSVLQNMRTRKDIVSDTFTGIGIDVGTKISAANATLLANFNRKFGERIELAQLTKGSELTETEMQDIADKLLILNKRDGWGWDRDERAMQSAKPEEFVAAASWDQVQADDQIALTNAYEAEFGKPPVQEEATDIYNRAMRFWLGAQPQTTEDEDAYLTRGYTQVFSKEPTPSQLETLRGRYLRKLLGR